MFHRFRHPFVKSIVKVSLFSIRDAPAIAEKASVSRPAQLQIPLPLLMPLTADMGEGMQHVG
jgi:hypothetical protein